MKRFYLKSDILYMLSGGIDSNSENNQKDKIIEAFIDAGIINKETFEMDSMAEALLNSYLTSKNRVVLHFYGEKEYKIQGFYFVDDLITMVSAYKQEGEFLWLPTGNYIIGILAELLRDVKIEDTSEEFESEFVSYCSEDNYKDVLFQYVREGKYRDILLNPSGKNELWMKGHGSNEEDQFFISVIFQEQKAYYYRLENRKFTYGCANEIDIIQILSNWMLKKHRELIIRMKESEADGI